MSRLIGRSALAWLAVGVLVGAPAQATDVARSAVRHVASPWVTARTHQIETLDGEMRFSETRAGKVTVLGRIHINREASADAFPTFFIEMKRVVPGIRQLEIELYGDNFETFRHNVHDGDKKSQVSAVKMTKLYRAVADNLGLKRVLHVKDASFDGVEVTLGR